VKILKPGVVLTLIFISIAVLAYSSYHAGYKASENNMDALLMTMTIDSNFVTTGLYEELPNKVRKTLSFYIEDTPSYASDIKLFAEVKYVTIDGEVFNVNNGNIWKVLKQERVFQRKFNNKNEIDSLKAVPNSNFANINLIEKSNNNIF
jgi:hypothetical protein